VTAIEVRNAHKHFGTTKALDGFDLTVEVGEVHGFLGPNGAGKTTTIRALLGLIRLDSGSASVLGADPWADAVALHKRLAYVSGDVTLWPNLTGGEVIDLLTRLRGAASADRRDELLQRFDLDPSKKSRTYSKGNRQKVALIAALAADVELLLLDEPTAGLDPLMEETFRQCIADERRRGRTVLLSSHILGEVEALCDTITIIKSGKRVESGSLADLRRLSATHVRAELQTAPTGLSDLPGVSNVHIDGTRVVADVLAADMTRFMSALTANGLVSLDARPPTLEELFLQHYEVESNGR